MTMTEHPITPPPELVHQWAIMFEHFSDAEVFTQVARWGANQELEACCEWLYTGYADTAKHLRIARRPKAPSLKEQALHELADVYDRDKIDDTTYDTIRRALEALPND
jgi:hypothetical protein